MYIYQGKAVIGGTPTTSAMFACLFAPLAFFCGGNDIKTAGALVLDGNTHDKIMGADGFTEFVLNRDGESSFLCSNATDKSIEISAQIEDLTIFNSIVENNRIKITNIRFLFDTVNQAQADLAKLNLITVDDNGIFNKKEYCLQGYEETYSFNQNIINFDTDIVVEKKSFLTMDFPNAMGSDFFYTIEYEIL
jgi:hypothetical protein